MIIPQAPDRLNRPNDGSSGEIKKSLTWKHRLYLRAWPKEITGSRDLGEALALDHEQAHRLAQDLEVAGLVTITEFTGDWQGWGWQSPPFKYTLLKHHFPPGSEALVPATIGSPSPSIPCALPTASSREVEIARNAIVAGTGASAFRITEDRFAEHRGALGRGALAMVWACEDRGKLGQAVKVADLVEWTGAHRNDIGRWLRRMEEQGAAIHHPNRSWSLTIAPSQTCEDFDGLMADLNAYGVAHEQKLALLDLLDRPIDAEQAHLHRVWRHRTDAKAVEAWKPSDKRATYEVRSCCRFRHHTPPEPVIAPELVGKLSLR